MNSTEFEGKWNQVKGELKQKYRKCLLMMRPLQKVSLMKQLDVSKIKQEIPKKQLEKKQKSGNHFYSM